MAYTENIQEAIGSNPNYEPPVMMWDTVEIRAPEGFTIGISRNEQGVLQLVVKPPDQDWPSDINSSKLIGLNTIASGHRYYIVKAD